MHKIYVYTYAWTRSCKCNGEDFGEVDRRKIERSHLPGKEEHSEGDDYSGRMGRSRLGEVKEEVLCSSVERRWQMLFARCPTARMLRRFDSLEAKITTLQHVTTESTPQPAWESCVPPLLSSIPEMPMAEFATELPPEMTTPLAELPIYHWQESSAFESPTIPL